MQQQRPWWQTAAAAGVAGVAVAAGIATAAGVGCYVGAALYGAAHNDSSGGGSRKDTAMKSGETGVGSGHDIRKKSEGDHGGAQKTQVRSYIEHDAASWINRSGTGRGRDEMRYTALNESGAPLLIFVAGDRSQVGKSSTCLGLIGALHDKLGYAACDLGYIKPATQCEGTQLISRYCKARGIDCVGVGPVVFFSGFTRSFLAGEQGTSEDLLLSMKEAVAELGRGKRIVIVDGVGYPAVGSICGISNAAVAQALGASVLLVGKRGVGDAVDSFNLNASFFESRGVPVLGGVFNRLPTDPKGYYSLDKCKAAVTLYFEKFRPRQMPFGFVPEVPELAEESEDENVETKAGALINVFWSHVDVHRILRAAYEQKRHGGAAMATNSAWNQVSAVPQKGFRLSASQQKPRQTGNKTKPKSREEVFKAEKRKGAEATK